MSSILGRLLRHPPFPIEAPASTRLGVPTSATGPRLPEGVDWADVLFLWDPQASYTRDWAGSQELSAGGSGSVTNTINLGVSVVTFDADTYLSAGTPFGTSLSDIGEFTTYIVGANNEATASALFYPFHITAPLGTNAVNAGAITHSLRRAPNRSFAAFWDETTFAWSQARNSLAQYVISQLTARVSTTEIESWQDGIQFSGAVAHTADPGSAVPFDQIDIGGCHNVADDVAGELYYVLCVSGGRSATVEAWLAAQFPIGETPSAP